MSILVMSILGRFLLKHLTLYLLGVWFLLTVSIFVLGIVELSMNRLNYAVGGGTGSIFVGVLRDRMADVPQYASETMAYAGQIGFLLGFWTLWRRGEFLQYQLLGGRSLLLRYAIVSGLLFGVLHTTVVETWKHRQERSSDQHFRRNLQIVRTTAQGGKIMLFSDRYRPSDGELIGDSAKGVGVLVLDEAFRVRNVFMAPRGRIQPESWVLFEGTRLDEGGEKTFFRQKPLAVETDMTALAHTLQPDPQILSLAALPKIFRAARESARDTKPFVDRALFLLSLPLFYASFGVLAYALCLTLPHRTTGGRMALFVILLPCCVEFVRHLAWSRVFGDSLHASLPAFGIPLVFACATGFLVRNERLFS